MTKVGLVFSISNFFINKISQGRSRVHGLASIMFYKQRFLGLEGGASNLRPGLITKIDIVQKVYK